MLYVNIKYVFESCTVVTVLRMTLRSSCVCTGNLLNCSANVSVTDIGSFTISLSWTRPVCSDVMPMQYLVQWAEESTSRLELSGFIPMNDTSYNISSLRANTVYNFFLVAVDDCGNMTAGRQTAQTLESNGKCRIGGQLSVGALSSGIVCVALKVNCTVV